MILGALGIDYYNQVSTDVTSLFSGIRSAYQAHFKEMFPGIIIGLHLCCFESQVQKKNALQLAFLESGIIIVFLYVNQNKCCA